MHKLEDWELGWDGTMSLEDYVFLLFEFKQKDALIQLVSRDVCSRKTINRLWKKFQKIKKEQTPPKKTL